MYVNAHEHILTYKDLKNALAEIKDNKIITLACSMDIEEYEKIKEISKENEYIIKGFGIHPWKVELDTKLDKLEKYIVDCDFIGEIGLDFFWDTRKEVYNKQIEVFEYFISMAKKHKKISNIHTKGAELEILKILKENSLENQIIHWYSGPLDLVDDYLSLNSKFTISSDIKYSKLTDQLIEKLPLENILTETDGPTSLEWVNGILSKPTFIKDIVKYIAKIKGLEEEFVKDKIYKNYLDLKIKWEKYPLMNILSFFSNFQ